MSSDTIRLKVTLEGILPPIWRRVEVPADITLAKLHAVIQVAMGWHDAHLHEFAIGDITYGEPAPEWDYGRVIKDDRRHRLHRVVDGAGSRFTYVYDLGDAWIHRIVVEKVMPSEPRTRYPRVVAGARACPPEDVGSVPGYADFLDAIADPMHPEHEGMIAWYGGPFDPEYFDLRAVNEAFDMVFAGRG
jgi:hypothetical protein